MTIETPEQRARRKFVFGVLEQASNILGAMTASTLVVGLVLPAIALFSGSSHVGRDAASEVGALVIGFALFSAFSAMVLRGLARRIDDDGFAEARHANRARRDSDATTGNV